jgi:hypothetical protein
MTAWTREFSALLVLSFAARVTLSPLEVPGKASSEVAVEASSVVAVEVSSAGSVVGSSVTRIRSIQSREHPVT